MLQKNRLRFLLLLVSILGLGGSSSVLCQDEWFAYDGPIGIHSTWRTLGGDWQTAIADPDHALRIGRPDASVPLDGFSLKMLSAKLEYQALVAGSWQPWMGQGKPAGVRKKPIGLLSMGSAWGRPDVRSFVQKRVCVVEWMG